MDLGISKRRALVLGASRGMGAAIARRLALEGVTIVAAARNTADIETWKQQLDPAARARVTAHEFDVMKIASVDALCDAMLKSGGVDILVNNTGGPPAKTALDTLRSDWLGQFEGMAANIIHLTHRLLAPMIQRKWGRVITITSSGIEQPLARLALSNGVRSALLGWSKTLSSEVAADGVTVNIVIPGRIQTDRLAELDRAAAMREGKSVEAIAKAMEATIPMQRYGTVDEFADVVAFLASANASYVTGSKIRVDGGAIRGV